MKLGFICINANGHLNPMTALARQLQSRNHEVIFLYSSDAAELPVLPEEQHAGTQDRTEEAIAEVSNMQGEDALHFYVRTIMSFTESILNSLPAVVAKTDVDVLLIDSAYLYAELGAIQVGMPYFHISNAMYTDYSGCTPLCFFGWAHEETAQAMARNRAGRAEFSRILESHRAGLQTFAKRAGLKVDWNDLSSTISPLGCITQVPRAFDFESSCWPDRRHHTGPFHDGMGRSKVDFPWERLTDEPLVYASMGTVVPRAPQLELLRQASVCITHAGLNTVSESLAQGVPQVAIPVAFDQPGVAARIAQRQTGVVTSLDKLGPGHVSELLDEVMTNSAYRAKAQKLKQEIAEANGLSVAADVVERAFGVGKEAKL